MLARDRFDRQRRSGGNSISYPSICHFSEERSEAGHKRGGDLGDAVELLGIGGLVVVGHGHSLAPSGADASGVPRIGHHQGVALHQRDYLFKVAEFQTRP